MKKRIQAKAAKDLQLKKSKEKENESQTGSTSLTRSISVITTPPRKIPVRNISMGRGNSELNITVNLNNLNSSTKDPTGFRLNSNQKLRKAVTETGKKRRIDLTYAEAVSTYQDFGIAKVGKKKGKSLRSICNEVGWKYGVTIARSSVSRYSRLWNGFQGKNLGRRDPAGHFRNTKIYNVLKRAWMSTLSLE